eukprot:scaffold43631_cov45-Attheya_sp.AAC.1
MELHDLKVAVQRRASSLSDQMRNIIADEIVDFGDSFTDTNGDIYNRSELIREDFGGHLKTPLMIIDLLKSTIQDVDEVVSGEPKKLTEDEVDNVLGDRSALLARLIPIRDKKQKERRKWDKLQALSRLRNILSRFRRVSEMKIFDVDKAILIAHELRQAEEDYRTTQERLKEEMPKDARLKMSTIGSSHKLVDTEVLARVSDVDDLANQLDSMGLLDDFDSNDDKRTVVIFDESGCIPAFELLGLSRICQNIEGVVLVGDKHQLPPYNPMQERQRRPPMAGTRSNVRRSASTMQKNSQLASLLDASTLSVDKGKVILNTQYRVPRDIADLLNDRIYRGQYNTSPGAGVPLVGLQLINVPKDQNPRKKYTNSNEVQEALQLIEENELDDNGKSWSMMVLTPYKNQQREIEFQLKRHGMNPQNVLTIDQCQGQEADVVVLSLVQKPTRFLTKNRLNVALSRVRKKLYILVDKQEFRDAAENSWWEGSLIAKDILRYM